MASKDGKKYYWLKLKEDFFEDDTIKFIEEQDNGLAYGWFYLKLCLKSLKTDGILVRIVGEMFLPYDAESLSKLTNTPVDTVRCALALLKKIGVIAEQDGGKLYLPQLVEMVGKETESASRMRKLRASQCSHIVHKSDDQVTEVLQISDTDVQKSDTEIRDEEMKREEIKPPISPKKFNPVEKFDFTGYSQNQRMAIISFMNTRREKGNPITESELPSFKEDIANLNNNDKADFMASLKKSLQYKGTLVTVLKEESKSINLNHNNGKHKPAGKFKL